MVSWRIEVRRYLPVPPKSNARRDLHAWLGDDSVVGVELAADDASDSDAVCSEANAVLETIVERLPKAD